MITQYETAAGDKLAQADLGYPISQLGAGLYVYYVHFTYTDTLELRCSVLIKDCLNNSFVIIKRL